MAVKDTLVKRLSKEKGIDPRVVRLVVDSPFKFARRVMADPDDWRPIMIRYFAKFIPKYGVLEEIETAKINLENEKSKEKNESKETHNKDTFI